MAVEGWGSALYSSPDGINYTRRSEVVGISGPHKECKNVNNTSLADAANNLHYRFKPGMADDGEIKVKLNFSLGEANFFNGVFGVQYHWLVLFSEGTGLRYRGYVNRFGFEIVVDDRTELPVNIKLAGKPQISAVFVTFGLNGPPTDLVLNFFAG